MAVFWKHIKGTGNAKNNDDGLWSWINWSIEEPILDQSDRLDENSRTMSWAPKIMCNYRNTTEDMVDLGHIITSNNLNQEIKKRILIQELSAHQVWLDKYDLYMYIDDPNQPVMSIEDNGSSAKIKITVKGDLNSTGNIDNIGNIINDGNIDNTGDIINVGNINNTGDIINSGQCRAEYFNATSDRRAKENICPLMASALDIINAVQVYTFNYKNSHQTTIGLIAQEVLPYNLGGATFVSNPDATGEDGDYMSITESKLVYLLLKGIQEQQEQINQLQQRIIDLEGE